MATEEPTDIQAWFAALPQKLIECRETGHAMKRQHKDYLEERDSHGRVIHVVKWRCTRCFTKRRNAYRPGTYARLWAAYDYPEGYQTHGAGLTRQGVRQL